MCHNCHGIMVDTNQQIKSIEEYTKRAQDLLKNNMINFYENGVLNLEEIIKMGNEQIQELKNVHGTIGTSDFVKEIMTNFNAIITNLNLIESKVNYFNVASNYVNLTLVDNEWLTTESKKIDAMIFAQIMQKLGSSFSKEQFLAEINNLKNDFENKKMFKTLKEEYIEKVINYKLTKNQKLYLFDLLESTQNIEELNTIMAKIESRTDLNNMLLRKMENTINEIRQIEFVERIEQGYEILHDNERDQSKIIFKVKKKLIGDVVTFEMWDDCLVKYTLSDYHTKDYQGSNNLVREEEDLTKIMSSLTATGFLSTKPEFHSQYGFIKNIELKERALPLKERGK